jgi:glyoxylase-like metal-dependent hydrolase (beta-lactamase superfamily II)
VKELVPGCLRLDTDYLQVCGLPLALHAMVDGDQLVLLDSGIASTPETFVRSELRAAGLRIEDVTLVVNSHAHPDHRGGNGAIRAAAGGARFAAPAQELGWFEDDGLMLRELWGANPEAYALTETEDAGIRDQLGDLVRIDQPLRDGDELPLPGGGLTVVTTSGHSPGHIAVHDPHRKLLFTFDDVQGRGTPFPSGDGWLAPLYHDVERYLGGLRRLRDLEFDLLLPSHGEPLDQDAGTARINESIAFVGRLDEFVQTYLDTRDAVGVRELAQAIGTQVGDFGGITLQTVSLARAHLDHAVRRGGVTPFWRRTPPPRQHQPGGTS